MNRIAMCLAVILSACGIGTDSSNDSASTSEAALRGKQCSTSLTLWPRTKAIQRAEAQAKAECQYCTLLGLNNYGFDCPLSVATQADVVAAAERATTVVDTSSIQYSTGTARAMTAAEIENEFGAGTTLPRFFGEALKGTIHGVAVVGSYDPSSPGARGRNDLFIVWGDAKHAYVVNRSQEFP